MGLMKAAKKQWDKGMRERENQLKIKCFCVIIIILNLNIIYLSEDIDKNQKNTFLMYLQ